MLLLVHPEGTVLTIYDEALPLRQLGDLTIRRASHVEPDASGHWWADLAPVEGPRLGPFNLRSSALAAEAAWLEERYLR